MAIIAKDSGGADIPKLSPGMYQAACSRAVDLGLQETPWGDSRKVGLLFVTKELIPEGEFEGKRYKLSKMYTLSLNSKANLRKDLEGWRGKGFSEQELAGFDIEKLEGVNCFINLILTEKNDKKYMNISTINPMPKGIQPIAVSDEDREIPNWMKEMAEKGLAKLQGENQEQPISAWEAAKEGYVLEDEDQSDTLPF